MSSEFGQIYPLNLRWIIRGYENQPKIVLFSPSLLNHEEKANVDVLPIEGGSPAIRCNATAARSFSTSSRIDLTGLVPIGSCYYLRFQYEDWAFLPRRSQNML